MAFLIVLAVVSLAALYCFKSATPQKPPPPATPPKKQNRPPKKRVRSAAELERLARSTPPDRFLRLPLDILLDERFIWYLDVMHLRAMDEYEDVPGNVTRRIGEVCQKRAAYDPEYRERLDLRFQISPSDEYQYYARGKWPPKKRLRRREWE